VSIDDLKLRCDNNRYRLGADLLHESCNIFGVERGCAGGRACRTASERRWAPKGAGWNCCSALPSTPIVGSATCTTPRDPEEPRTVELTIDMRNSAGRCGRTILYQVLHEVGDAFI
jgi:hypothetical protein